MRRVFESRGEATVHAEPPRALRSDEPPAREAGLPAAAMNRRRPTAACFVLALAAALAGCATPLSPTPPPGMPAQVAAPEIRAGTAWTYTLHDGYTKLSRGTLAFHVAEVGDKTVTVRLSTAAGESVERYTRDWNWIERPMTNLQNFRFDPPYPALPFPLAAGKTWVAYVRATDPLDKRVNRVRIDGKVLGWERVHVPAGTFDTVVVRRVVYAGNEDWFREEEHIREIDWYAPALGLIVRHESSSGYRDKMRSTDRFGGGVWIHNDWNVLELVSHSPAQ
jgi:hypothetical protein